LATENKAKRMIIKSLVIFRFHFGDWKKEKKVLLLRKNH
jgi:hypothetical protein